MFKEIKEKSNKKAAKVCGIGRHHRPSDGCRSVSCPQRWLYISSLVFGSDLQPPTHPQPPLPLLYAVMQADVGLFCCVLLSLSPLPPDYIPTSRTEEKNEKKKNHMQYMDYEKCVKINNI